MFEIENNLTTQLVILIVLFILFYFLIMNQVDSLINEKLKKNKKSIIKQIMYIYKKYNKKNEEQNYPVNNQNIDYNNYSNLNINYDQEQEQKQDTDEDSLDDVGGNFVD